MVLDTETRKAVLYPDALGDLRTAGSHGPGPFLAASRCGDDCFQPIRWSTAGWQPLGHPIEFDPRSTLHFTYDRSGAPWLVFHRLSDRKGALRATAYRWDGRAWSSRGELLVQGVGSPGATSDPSRARAILSGTGRFDADLPPTYWLPALPATTRPDDVTSGGHVVALAKGAAIFLTFDGRVTSTLDGETWRLERWTPWPNPLRRDDLWIPGVDYSVDRPAGSDSNSLRLLWYDDRQTAAPTLHLTRWAPDEGWVREATLDLTAFTTGSNEYVVHSPRGWLLVGECRNDAGGSLLDALVVSSNSPAAEAIEIQISLGWSD